MNQANSSLSLSEMNLRLPSKGQQTKVLIQKYGNDFSKVGNLTQTTLQITDVQTFTFNFCYKSRKVKQDVNRYAFKAEPYFSNMKARGAKPFPYCWAALPYRDIEQIRIIIAVSWAPEYSDRFVNLKSNEIELLNQFHPSRKQRLAPKQEQFNF